MPQGATGPWVLLRFILFMSCVLAPVLAIAIWATWRMSRGMDWGIFQNVVVGGGSFMLAGGIIATLVCGSYSFFRMVMGWPEKLHASEEETVRVPKPGVIEFLTSTASSPTDYGWAGVLVMVLSIAVTSASAFLGVNLFSPGTTAPRIVFAIPGLVVGGFSYLVIGAVIHFLLPAKVTWSRRPMANGSLFFLVLGAVLAALYFYVNSLVR